jgi:hypothetical protein
LRVLDIAQNAQSLIGGCIHEWPEGGADIFAIDN